LRDVTGARIRPFPWRSLEATTRAEVSALRDVKRWAASHVRVDQLARTFGELLGAEVELHVRRAQPLAISRAIGEGVGVLLARADDPGIARSVLIEAEGALAANVVARALRRPTSRLVTTEKTPSPGLAGAFAAIVVAAARRAHQGVPICVRSAGPAGAVEASLAELEPELWAISLTVLVAHDAFAARVIVSRAAAISSAAPAWDAGVLASLGPTPLVLPIVACATWAAAADVATLRSGDAFMPRPSGKNWEIVRGGRAGAMGPVLLAPPSSDLGLGAQLGEDGHLVLRGRLEPLLATEAHMDSDERGAVVATLGEVPVVVRVEIGEATMSARDWASLGRGDVVALGRRVGEPVLLRVGGIPLARGELVEIDGEVGVRILERLLGEGATTP
jgi:flagellar motor switch/type III secretory pathway protein FliN